MKPEELDQFVLNVCDLRICRGDTLILDNISWQIRRQQHWVILGANGSGKTSLLKALNGYLTPTGGTISIFGQRYGQADWRELRTHIGLVSASVGQMMANEEPALETVISGKYAMIDFWGKPTAADRVQAQRMLKLMECSHVEQRRWEVLSQGERQRVLIGRALMAHPRLLILDEPCAGLDPAAREHFLQFVQRLGATGHAPSLIFVTHHVEEIMPVFSHILILKAGKVLASGPKGHVLNGRLLSRAFDTPMRVRKERGSGVRYVLKQPRPIGFD